jgi:L-threonylcarbamoyladenylate synthase
MRVSKDVFVAPTDTVYGLLTSAFNKSGIEKIYKIKGRDKDKRLIILISGMNDLKKFDIKLSKEQKIFLEKNWPNQLSVGLESKDNSLKYLHLGFGNISFRMPKKIKKNKIILDLIKKYGPLVAPSANMQGEKTVETINEAEKVFGDSVDFYISNKKRLLGKPSTLVTLNKDGSFEILRQGNYKIKK